ncbi:MAG: PAS domain S-box protein [Spirochaetes bacterium]|nr:PAS domain S-box protein [Spirochaetota bacterium]
MAKTSKYKESRKQSSRKAGDKKPVNPSRKDKIDRLTFELKERSELLERFTKILQRKIKELKTCKEKLDFTEIRYKELFENMNCGVAVYEAVDDGDDFIFKDFNKTAEVIERVKRDNIIGKRVTAAFPGVKKFGVFKVFQNVYKTGKPEFFPEAVYKDDRDTGTWRENWVYKLPDGHIVSVYNNVTERKMIEQALDETIGSYQSLAKNMPGLVYRIHLKENGRMEFFNRMAEVMTGYKKGELKKRKICSIDQLILKEDRATVLNEVRKAVKENRAFEVEYRIKRKDGQIRYFIERGRPIIGNEGEPLFIDGVIFDATEKKLIEIQLRKSEERYRQLVMNAPDIIMSVDWEGKIQFVNRAPAGLSSQDVIGKNVLEFIPDQGQEETEKSSTSFFSEGFSSNYEMEGLATGRWYSTRIGALRSDDDEAELTVIARDITERKKAEDMMKSHNAMLQETVKKVERKMDLLIEEQLRYEKLAALGSACSNAAHEIETPIGSISQSIQSLKDEMTSYPDSIKEKFEFIQKELNKTGNIIKKMMDSANYTSVKKEMTDLETIIEQAVRRCGLNDNIKLNIILNPKKYTVWADPLLLQHVFINLLNNSKEAISENGNITIYAETTVPENQADSNYLIEIWDDGRGIDDKILNNVFMPLFTTKPNGAGLGLGICKQIIDNHGGKISIQSRADVGTLVKVLLPMEKK